MMVVVWCCKILKPFHTSQTCLLCTTGVAALPKNLSLSAQQKEKHDYFGALGQT